jgi:hypothetical protein
VVVRTLLSEEQRSVSRDAGLQATLITLEEVDARAHALYHKVLRDYEAAGEPNGPGHNGLMRWVMSQEPAEYISTA